MNMRRLTIEVEGKIVILDPLWVDYICEDPLPALGLFALTRSPLAFLDRKERAQFCDVPLARYLPEAIRLSEVLVQLP